jgi:hypothetical protein
MNDQTDEPGPANQSAGIDYRLRKKFCLRSWQQTLQREVYNMMVEAKKLHQQFQSQIPDTSPTALESWTVDELAALAAQADVALVVVWYFLEQLAKAEISFTDQETDPD